MANRPIAKCPKCGTENDLTAETQAAAKKSPTNQQTFARGKCKKCGGGLTYGPFDPIAAQEGWKQ